MHLTGLEVWVNYSMILFDTVHTILHDTVQYCMLLYNNYDAVQYLWYWYRTKLYKTVQNCTQLTKLYKTEQNCTKLYNTLLKFLVPLCFTSLISDINLGFSLRSNLIYSTRNRSQHLQPDSFSSTMRHSSIESLSSSSPRIKASKKSVAYFTP